MPLGELPAYHKIPGRLVIVDKQPDGDSIRFVPDEHAQLDELVGAGRLRVSSDGSVQLRLDSVDAPELHYQSEAQPLGDRARDALLAHVGFTAKYQGTTVQSAVPEAIPVTIWTRTVEIHGRPVAYLSLTEGGDEVDITQSVNAWLLEQGWAYPTFYESTDARHRAELSAIADRARQAGIGVWPHEQSREFPLRSQHDIGPTGALILPKLFRRCTRYLHDVASGSFRGTLIDWFLAFPGHDDTLWIDGQEMRFHDLITLNGDAVSLRGDPFAITFVAK